MHKIQTYNKISPKGLNLLDKSEFSVSDSESNPDAILVRSQNLKDEEFSSGLKAIGRAGAGVNNIPVEKCTKNGVVVFNTPGANANAVKELVLASLFIASRNIVDSVKFVENLDDIPDEEFKKIVEKNKSNFKGSEIKGKTLGVIGLGAIGKMVANSGLNLDMKVIGFDPYITVSNAWGLSNNVTKAESLDQLLAKSDFISIHMPLTAGTQGIINAEALAKVKDSCVFLNFSRDGIVNEDDMKKALDESKLKAYITDFGTHSLAKHPKVVCMPHIGASTKEAEDNCAIMIAEQIKSFLKDGNIVNSVNFPTCAMERSGDFRLTILNDNVPNMVSQITTVLGSEDLNIQGMVNKSRDDIAYNIVDLGNKPSDALLEKVQKIEGVRALRVL